MRTALPVPAVKGLDVHVFDRALVEAAQVHAVAVGVGARHVERLDAAVATEKMLRHARAEGVAREAVGALQQAEARRRHDQVQETGHVADGAVAFAHRDARRRLELETHLCAMAAAVMDRHARGLRVAPRDCKRRCAPACPTSLTRKAGFSTFG